jgi:hypothetical protein
MKSTPFSSVWIVAIVGCSGDAKPPITGMPDAGTDAPADSSAPSNYVDVETLGDDPVFIRYREGSGPWQEPKRVGANFELRINERYELIAVCGDTSVGFDVGVEASTFEDSGGSTYLPCFTPFAAGATHKLSGTMAQPGTVTIGYASATGAAASWSFELDAYEGTVDLLAVGGGRARLVRDIEVTTATTVPAISVSSSPLLASLPLTVTGLQSSDVLHTQTILLTANSFLTAADETSSTARLVPDSQLEPLDRQYVLMRAESGDTYRRAFFRHVSSASMSQIALLPPLTDVQLAGSTASWTTLPSGRRQLLLYSPTSSFHIFATEDWLGTSTSLTLDTEIPGFMPDWKPSAINYAAFEIIQSAAGVSLRTGVQQVGPMLTGKRD